MRIMKPLAYLARLGSLILLLVRLIKNIRRECRAMKNMIKTL